MNGSPEVPHMSLLNFTQADLEIMYGHLKKPAKRRRIMGKQASVNSTTKSYANAWQDYIEGHVVSEHARRLIQSFLMNTMAASQHDEKVDDEEADASEEDEAVLDA